MWKSRPTASITKFPAADYWDTLNVQALDSHTVEITAKRAGKPMLTEFDEVSPDGDTLTQIVTDTTEAVSRHHRHPLSQTR